jgi:hypothetical protein
MSFVYHANALAFGGVFNKPCCDVIPSQASVVLAPSGGEGSQTVRNFNYKGIVSFDEASAYVGGSQKGRFRNTVATVMIRNLNLLNMIHVELLCARVTSEHLAVDEKEQSGVVDEPEFTFEGSIIDNIRIAGRKVNVKLDHGVFSRYPTHTGFIKGMAAADGTNTDDYKKRFCWPATQCVEGVLSNNDVIRASLVEDMDIPQIEGDEDFTDVEVRRRNDKVAPVRRNGYIVRIADFGTVAIGEVILKQGQRTVNMLRWTLGSPNDGSGTAGSGTTNGTAMVP